MDSRDYNLENLEEAEYDKFEVEGDDTVLELALSNSIGPSTGMLGMPTSKSTSRIPKRLRSVVW